MERRACQTGRRVKLPSTSVHRYRRLPVDLLTGHLFKRSYFVLCYLQFILLSIRPVGGVFERPAILSFPEFLSRAMRSIATKLRVYCANRVAFGGYCFWILFFIITVIFTIIIFKCFVIVLQPAIVVKTSDILQP